MTSCTNRTNPHQCFSYCPYSAHPRGKATQLVQTGAIGAQREHTATPIRILRFGAVSTPLVSPWGMSRGRAARSTDRGRPK